MFKMLGSNLKAIGLFFAGFVVKSLTTVEVTDAALALVFCAAMIFLGKVCEQMKD